MYARVVGLSGDKSNRSSANDNAFVRKAPNGIPSPLFRNIFSKSSIYTVKNRGLNTHPCATPLDTLNRLPSTPLANIRALTPVYILMMTRRKAPPTPYSDSFRIRVGILHVSNALLKSAIRTWLPRAPRCDARFRTFCTIAMLSVHLRPCLKPFWAWTW